MATKGTPEIAVNRTEIAGLATKAPRVFFVGPFLPDVHSLRAQVRLVRVAGKKPKQLFRDPAEGNLLCRDDRKTLAQIKSSLKSEMRNRPDAGAVLMLGAVLEN